MTVAGVRTGVVGILQTAGAKNVTEEELTSLDLAKAVLERVHEDRTHFWVVKMSPLPPAGGAGYVELRHRVRIEGYLGVARDDPGDGVKSDVTAANLATTIVSALAAIANLRPGSSLDSDGILPDPLVTIFVTVGSSRVPVHRIGITYTVYEDA